MTAEIVGLDELLRRTLRARADSLPVDVGTAPNRQATLSRTLAAAASSSDRVLSGAYISSCGRITTHVRETEEARLIAEITTDDPDVAFVAMEWTLVDDEGISEPRRLVTPFAAGRNRWLTAYDLGEMRGVSAISICAAEQVPVESVTVAEIDRTLSLRLLGSAMRAWRSVTNGADLSDDLVEEILRRLDDL